MIRKVNLLKCVMLPINILQFRMNTVFHWGPRRSDLSYFYNNKFIKCLWHIGKFGLLLLLGSMTHRETLKHLERIWCIEIWIFSKKRDYIASFCSESDFLDFSISDHIIGLKSIRSTSELKLILLEINLSPAKSFRFGREFTHCIYNDRINKRRRNSSDLLSWECLNIFMSLYLITLAQTRISR